jgi:hypothetical protein
MAVQPRRTFIQDLEEEVSSGLAVTSTGLAVLHLPLLFMQARVAVDSLELAEALLSAMGPPVLQGLIIKVLAAAAVITVPVVKARILQQQLGLVLVVAVNLPVSHQYPPLPPDLSLQLMAVGRSVALSFLTPLQG